MPVEHYKQLLLQLYILASAKGALLELQVRLLNLRTFSSRANSAGTFGDECYCGIQGTVVLSILLNRKTSGEAER